MGDGAQDVPLRLSCREQQRSNLFRRAAMSPTNINDVCRHKKNTYGYIWLWLGVQISSSSTRIRSFFFGLPVRFALLTLCPSLCQGPAGPSPPLLLPFLLNAGIQLGDCSNPQYGVLDPLKNPERERRPLQLLFLTCKKGQKAALHCLLSACCEELNRHRYLEEVSIDNIFKLDGLKMFYVMHWYRII